MIGDAGAGRACDGFSAIVRSNVGVPRPYDSSSLIAIETDDGSTVVIAGIGRIQPFGSHRRKSARAGFTVIAGLARGA